LQGQGRMIGFQKRRLPSFVLALAIFLLGCLVRFAHAEEPDARAKPEQAQAAEQPGVQTKPKESPANAAKAGGASAPGQAFDQAVVSAGMAAFERSCTKCHDAARSLERTKDLAGWRATVRRMAAT